MQENHLCKLHLKEFRCICIEDHKCPDIRICEECCFTNHYNIEKEKTPLIENFSAELLLKLNNYLEHDFNQYMTMLQALAQFEEKLQELLKTTRVQIMKLLESITNIDTDIAYIKSQLEKDSKNILEFSQSDLIFMVSIINGQVLSIRENEKKMFQQYVLDKITQMTDSTVNLQQSVTSKHRDQNELEGPKILEMKCGDFYFSYQDKFKEYAGMYQLDLKEGLWKEHIASISVGTGEWEKKYQFVKYQKGQRLGILNEFGQLNFEGRRIGQWLELCGNNKQLQMNGFYEYGVKVGRWIVMFNSYIIGGGKYDQQGKKQGSWIEPHNQFEEQNAITYQGEYKEGKRFGIWTINQNNQFFGSHDFEDAKNMAEWSIFDSEISKEQSQLIVIIRVIIFSQIYERDNMDTLKIIIDIFKISYLLHYRNHFDIIQTIEISEFLDSKANSAILKSSSRKSFQTLLLCPLLQIKASL